MVINFQGTTSTKYYLFNYKLTNLLKMFNYLGIIHSHRYDIPDGYNPKLGYIYHILLFDENNNLIGVCEKHPINGEYVIATPIEKCWDYFKDLTLKVYKDRLTEEYKKY